MTWAYLLVVGRSEIPISAETHQVEDRRRAAAQPAVCQSAGGNWLCAPDEIGWPAQPWNLPDTWLAPRVTHTITCAATPTLGLAAWPIDWHMHLFIPTLLTAVDDPSDCSRFLSQATSCSHQRTNFTIISSITTYLCLPCKFAIEARWTGYARIPKWGSET